MKITKGTGVTVSSNGNHYTPTATSADAKIAPGAKVSFTFTGSFTGSYRGAEERDVHGDRLNRPGSGAVVRRSPSKDPSA